jgi:hypothetical protein
MNNVSESLNKKHHSIAIFCDLKKAFDTVDHSILLKKLKKIGICENALKWFSNYLSNRQQYVCVGSAASTLKYIRTGVPQGSILGPLLFLLYINDLPTISALLSFLFADDTTLLSSHNDLNHLVNFVNIEFQKIVHYFRAHKMSLHPEKTKFMLFSNSPNANLVPTLLYINNNNVGENSLNLIPIEQITSLSKTPAIKFLGIFLDPALSFKYHIQTITAKISKALYFIRSAKNILSEKALKSLYYSLVHCHLVYGIHIWSCTNPSNLKNLEVKQKAAVRLITNSNYNAHTEPLFKKNNILPLQLLAQFFKIQFFQQFKHQHLPAIFENTWQANFERYVPERHMQLRDDEEYYVPFARINQIEKFPLFAFPKLWNNLEDAPLKGISSKIEFNIKLKLYFMNKLDSNYVCTRLLCPNCHILR